MNLKQRKLGSIHDLPGRIALRLLTAFAAVLAFSIISHSACANDAAKGKEHSAVSDTVALQMEADSIEKAFTNAVGKLDNQKETRAAMSSGFVWMLVGGGLLGLVVMVRYIPGLMEMRDVTY